MIKGRKPFKARIYDDTNRRDDYFKNLLLWTAVINGRKQLVTELIQNGIPVNYLDSFRKDKHVQAIHTACKLGGREMIEELLKHGADVNTIGVEMTGDCCRPCPVS